MIPHPGKWEENGINKIYTILYIYVKILNWLRDYLIIWNKKVGKICMYVYANAIAVFNRNFFFPRLFSGIKQCEFAAASVKQN